MKPTFKALTIAAATAGLFTLAGCDIDKTEDGRMPEVNVDVKEGKLPKYDVDTADVEVRTETKTIEVPTGVEVTMPDDK